MASLWNRFWGWAEDVSDFGAGEAAAAQADAQRAATQAQRDIAANAQTYAEEMAGRAALGYDQARFLGQRRLDQGYAGTLDALMQGYAGAEGALNQGVTGASGALQSGQRTAAGNLNDLANMQAIGGYDVLGQRPMHAESMLSQGIDVGGDFDFEADPGYQFRRQQGEEAINRAAAAQGGRNSGRTLKALSEFNQNLASQEYGAAAARDAQQKERLLAARGLQQNLAQSADSTALAALLNQAGRFDEAALNAQRMRGAGLTALSELNMGTAQQLADLYSKQGANLASMYQQQGGQLANAHSNYATQSTQLLMDEATGKGNAMLGVGSNASNLAGGLMNAYNNAAQYAGGVEAARGQAQANMASGVATVAGKLWDWWTAPKSNSSSNNNSGNSGGGS